MAWTAYRTNRVQAHRRLLHRLAILGSLLLLGVTLPRMGWGQTDERVGTVLVLEGTAEVRAARGGAWEGLRFRDAIFLNDTVRTAAASKVKILLRDDSIFTLAEQSTMQFTEFLVAQQQKRSVVNLLAGKVRVLTSGLFGGRAETEVHTPNAVAGVRGSEEHVDYASGTRQTTVLCVSGDCFMRDPRDPNKVLPVPEGHIAQQTGTALPARTRPATATERQAVTAGTQATEQDPQETETTEEQARQALTETPGPRRGEAPGIGPDGPPPSAIITAGPLQGQFAELAAGFEARFIDTILFPAAGDLHSQRASPQTNLIPSPDTGPTGREFVEEQLRLRVIVTIPRQ